MNREFQAIVRAEAIASRDQVNEMLRQVQDLAEQTRYDLALGEPVATLLKQTAKINNLLGYINTQIRGYGRHWA